NVNLPRHRNRVFKIALQTCRSHRDGIWFRLRSCFWLLQRAQAHHDDARASPIRTFADMGDAAPGVGSVKKTRVSQAFAQIGHTMVFLFDYGDDWHFRVILKAKSTKLA